MFRTPSNYYDRYSLNPDAKGWIRVLWNIGKTIQSAELNEMQTVQDYQFEQGFRHIFSEGQFVEGGAIEVNPGVSTGFVVVIEAGTLYASGKFHTVGSGEVEITGVGTEIVGLLIETQIITSVEDVELLDPARNAENYGYSGADRMKFSYTYVLNNPNAVPIATFIDGQLVVTQQGNGLFQQILDLLALRTFEQSGNFVTTPPLLEMVDIDVPNPTQMTLIITNGVGYPKGYRVQNQKKTFINVDRTLDSDDLQAEPHLFSTGTYPYTLNVNPVMSVSEVEATLLSPTIPMTRGNVVNGQDAIPNPYSNVETVVSITQGVTTYVSGVDYNLVGSFISWLPGGNQPATGSSYSLVVRYRKVLTLGIRTHTFVSNEAQTVAGATTSLAQSRIERIILLTDTDANQELFEGTDYTINRRTGVITWITVSPSTNVEVDYNYWATTTEGDYLARNSFVDSNGNVLSQITPKYSPSIDETPGVDYTKQVVFDTSSGIVPVNGTFFSVDYLFGLPRIDVLGWHRSGLFKIFRGNPGQNPQAVIPSDDHVPICKLHLPADCLAEDVVFEYYNNRTMLVTDLRSMFNQLLTVQYNLSQFQLESNTLDVPTPTNKRGIFADPLKDPHLADITNGSFGGTFDFLDQSFASPRTQGVQSTGAGTLTLTGASASLTFDTWMTNYIETVAIQQPFQSEATQINEFGFVNTNALVKLVPAAALDVVDQNTISIHSTNSNITVLPSHQASQNMLLEHAVPGSWMADQGGEGSTLPNKMLEKIAPEPGWVSVAQSSGGQAQGVASSNYWGTILATTSLVASRLTVSNNLEITIQGSKFTPSERAITAVFDGIPVELTGISGTTQDPQYDGCVVANIGGSFNATFLVPPDTVAGEYTLQVVGRRSDDISVVKSIAVASIPIGTYIREVSLQVSFNHFFADGAVGARSIFAYAEILGLGTTGPTIKYPVPGPMYMSGYSPIAYTIAYGVYYANLQGITLNHSSMVGALFVLFSNQTAFASPPTDQLDAIASAMDLNSTSVQDLVAQLYTLPYWYLRAPIYHGLSYDPIAQTFIPPQDQYITSIELYFNTLPTDKVTLALAEVDDGGNPTSSYLALTSLDAASITSTTGPTKFTFNKPVFVKKNTEYCFVIMTEDPVASIWIARLGQNDQQGNLIVKNPYSGAMFKSPNSRAWQLDPTAQVRFNVNAAQFTAQESIINLGLITLPQTSSRIAFYIPFIEVTHDTTVTYQYSFDGTKWVDFYPLKEIDFGTALTQIRLRVLLKGTDSLSPQVLNSAVLQSFIWISNGDITTPVGFYVHRAFAVDDCSVVEMFLDTSIPGNTNLKPSVTFDDVTWYPMVEVTADQVQLDDQYIERHYTYSTAVNTVNAVVGGTAATGESYQITALSSTIEGGGASVSSAITTGQTQTQKATNLAAAINASSIFSAAGITATSVTDTVTISYPSSSTISISGQVVGGVSDTISVTPGTTNTPIYEQSVRTRVGFCSTVNYVTARTRNIRVIARR